MERNSPSYHIHVKGWTDDFRMTAEYFIYSEFCSKRIVIALSVASFPIFAAVKMVSDKVACNLERFTRGPNSQ